MADFPPFAFTTQESWYGELSFKAAEDGSALSLAGRQFEMHITPATSGAQVVPPAVILTMEEGRGLLLKTGDPSTLVFRVPRTTANAFPRGEFTADVLEVVNGERYLFMPVRITYAEPSGLRAFLTRFLGVSVSFASRQQPIYTPLAVPGREGRPGATILRGTVPPVPADGKDGDYFIEDRTASGQGRRMWGPKAAGQWPGTPWTIQVARYTDVPGLTGALDTLSGELGTVSGELGTVSGELGTLSGALDEVTDALNLIEFPSVAAARAASIPAAKQFVRVAGSETAGDRGAGLYRRLAMGPSNGVSFSSADGALWELADTDVRPQQAGGADDGATANDTAWNSIRAANRPFALPRVSQGQYLFDAPLFLAGASVDPAPGATLRAPKGADFSPTFRTTRSLKVGLRVGDGDTADYIYEFTPDHNRPRREKVVWPSLGSINRDRYEKIDPRAMRHVAVGAGQDGLSGTIPGSVTDRDVVFPLGADNVIRASLLPVRGGQDLRWARSPGNYPGDFVSGIFVRTTAGYYFLYAGATGAATLLTKLVGEDAASYTGIGWPGMTTDPLFSPGFAYWGVRIYNSRSFALLINGYKAFGPWPVQGEIIEAGPGFLGTKTIDAGAGWLNRVYRTGEAGGALAGILCLGDSLTEDIHGGWTHVMAEALDGFRGIRITNLVNYAKGGDAVFQQLATLKARGIPAGTTHAVVMVGANDFAGSASTDDFTLGHLTEMIDILVAASVRVLLMVPFGSYTRAAAGGRGANVTRPMSPSRTQMMIAAHGASKGVKVLDMNDVTGPLIGEFAAHSRVEPMLRDNVHPSAFGYKVLGLAAADALADDMIQPMGPDVPGNALGASFRNRIINGDFRINQRSVSASIALYPAGTYTRDRWKSGPGGAEIWFDGSDNGDVIASVRGSTLIQVVEGGLYLREGGTYVLSWTGTAQARVYQGAASGSYASSPVVVSLVAGMDAVVEFTNGSATRVQLEPGLAATPFERRDDEADRCRRYFQRLNNPPLKGTAAGGAITRMSMPLYPRMRTAPTATLGGFISVFDGSTTGTLTAINTNYSTTQLLECDMAYSSAAEFIWARIVTVFQGDAGYIDLAAEL